MTDDLQKSNINSSPAEQAQEGILVPHSSENALLEELNKGKWGKYIRFAMAAFGWSSSVTSSANNELFAIRVIINRIRSNFDIVTLYSRDLIIGANFKDLSN